MSASLFVGLMSGTSLDGADAVLADFSAPQPRILARNHRPFGDDLRRALEALTCPGDDEIDRAGALGNRLAAEYAAAVAEVLRLAGVGTATVRAIGCHGQTVRHRPERGYTVQIGNAALLAETCGIAVVADFRSRDIAAGGQGAPLVPDFHAAMFRSDVEIRTVLNLGGIANVTWLPPRGTVTGFDCGPGNTLLDAWASQHRGTRFDESGRWAASGREDAALLARMRDEPYFRASPPKSTGRELFNPAWLRARLGGSESAADVQATLVALTARTVSDALRQWCRGSARLIVCGGGTQNRRLMERIAEENASITVESSASHGVGPLDVEALAFAWLARERMEGRPASLPSVTGARGARVLGTIYSA